MIEIELRKYYPGLMLSIMAKINSGGVTAIMGPSGSGKSTLLKILAGHIDPDCGFLRFKGRLFIDSKQDLILPPEKRGVGYVFQESRLFPHLNVKGNLEFPHKCGNRPKPSKEEMEKVVNCLGIDAILQRKVHDLSGGEKQRVAIGRALLSRPDILLMDEPLASLDETRKDGIIKYIREFSETTGVPVLYVTHSLEEARLLADRAILMEGGMIAKRYGREELQTISAPLALARRAADEKLPYAGKKAS